MTTSFPWLRSIRRYFPTIGIVLIAATVFTWSAEHNGWMNDYYSAAALSGATSWRAFFFASFDSASFVSIDKPPFATWLSAASVALFGASPLAIALPHIVAGILTAVLIYRIVVRVSSIKLGLLATGLFLSTPITSVMFGYNQPDSILTLLVVTSAYTFFRAVHHTPHRTRWAIATGAILGLAFMTKTLQVLPLCVVYASYTGLHYHRRQAYSFVVLRPVLFAVTAFILVAVWWPFAVGLTPPQSRPYVGSTSDNSSWSLIVGYNGIGRLASPDQATAQTTDLGAQFGGEPGIARLINSEFAPLIAWYAIALIPAAVGLWRSTIPRKQRQLVGITLAITALYAVVFSFMRGVIHPYYVVMLAPFIAIAAAFGLRWSVAWYQEKRSWRIYIAPSVVGLSGLTAAFYLNYDSAELAQIGVVLACMTIAVSVILIAWRRAQWPRWVVWSIVLSVIMAGPIIQTFASLARSHRGTYPSTITTDANIAVVPKPALDFLRTHDDVSRRWIAATQSVSFAAPIQLATNRPVMALGGFNGTDPILSLQDLQSEVHDGHVRYYVTSSIHQAAKSPTAEWLSRHTIVYQDSVVTIYDLRNDPQTRS